MSGGVLDWFLQAYFRGKWGVENVGLGIWLPLVVMMVLLLVWRKSRKAVWWWLMIVGGGVNLGQKYFYGGVWDYLRLPIINVWINGSDILLSLAVIVVGLGVFDSRIREKYV